MRFYFKNIGGKGAEKIAFEKRLTRVGVKVIILLHCYKGSVLWEKDVS